MVKNQSCSSIYILSDGCGTEVQAYLLYPCVELFKSFMTMEWVRQNKVLLGLEETTFRVPQGNVMKPLLYPISIRLISEIIKITTATFADDVANVRTD